MLSQLHNQTFGGIHLSQIWNDLYLWERVLNHHAPARIIELGTLYGGMSAFLEAQARVRGATFHTFDHQALLQANDFIANYHLGDIFAPEGLSQVGGLISSPGLVLLFCDNGAKEKEAETFGPFLKPGDMLAVHDWGTECHKVPGYLELYIPEPGIYEQLQSMTRFFTR